MKIISLRSISTPLLVALLFWPALAQGQVYPNGNGNGPSGPFTIEPQLVDITSIDVLGVGDESTKSFLIQTSGLELGQQVNIPLDPAFADAIRSIFRLGNYDDVRVTLGEQTEEGINLLIEVQEVPRLGSYEITGTKKGHAKEIQEDAPLVERTPVRPADVQRTEQLIIDYYTDRGRPLTEVDILRTPGPGNTVDLEFQVDQGPLVEIQAVNISGVEQISHKKLRKKTKTKADAWWRFWKKAKYEENQYEEDLETMVTRLSDLGFYDARVVRDSVYLQNEDGEKPGMVIDIAFNEGPKYHIRNIDWEGNTVYTDEFLTQSLGFIEGEPYNGTKLNENLYANKRSSDVSSIYMNRGYMTFRLQPTIRVVEGDSLDMSFDLSEGDIFEFGQVEIQGNDKTRDHVIRRELYTIPGQTFSRDSIQESIRRLMQLNYFSQESLGGGPTVDVDEARKKVNLTYNLEETGSDQLQLSGTWGQFGLILSLGFDFNNFSSKRFFQKGAWKPLPAGDGQQLSIAVQASGRFYQNYSFSFTEPWFRGKPTPVGFSVSYSKIGQSPYFRSLRDGQLGTLSGQVFLEKRLRWPDDKFSYRTGVGYQYTNNDSLYFTLPQGVSEEITLKQTLARNSTDNPLFPQRGSLMRLSLDIALPIGNFIQYHKWRFQNAWHIPLANKLTLSVGADYGYVGSLTGEDVQFQRFVVGGSPFDTQGNFNRFFFAQDIVYLRGYPSGALGPQRNGEPFGGRILNKYTSELRWMAIASEQLQAAPYLFMDGANTWNDFDSYNPADLKRSAGFGMRFFLPILGMLELAYGYNFDTFDPPANTRGSHSGDRQWLFQFTIGQGFNQ